MNERTDNQGSNIFEQIDSICQEFRQQWKQNKRPRIEDCMGRVDPEARPTLFLRLLQSDIKYRRRQQEHPKDQDYLKRFPQFTQQIRQEFDGSTIMSADALHSPPRGSAGADVETRTLEFPAANQLGDYELVRELGRGAFGVVYEAIHRQRQNRVALKTLPTGRDGRELNADRLHRFRREFRALSNINHPNLVGMQTLEVDGGQWFFTMDLIDGEDFLSYVRPDNKLDESRMRSALPQMINGIIELHERHIVHRDLKPSNVMVEKNGQVVILDFGLVAEMQQATDQTASLKSAMFAGTPRYASPEQVFGDRSEASDWYALGVMMYESLTGGPPLTGNHLELLRKKQTEDPPPLVGREDLPDDLACLTDQLLKRDPKQRPDSLEIAHALSLDLASKSYRSVDGDDFDGTLSMDSDQVLIGREVQLAQLEQAKHDLLKKREPIIVFISGLSGEGKSTLAEKFLQPVRLGREMLVLSGRCYDRESVPFKVIDSQIDALVRFMRSKSNEEVQKLLPEDIHLLAHLFPLLQRVEAIAKQTIFSNSGIDDKQIRHRAFAALQDLLKTIGRTTPIVMFIDDLQWGDADSAEVLLDLLTSSDPPAVMVLGSCRSDEVENSPYLQHWKTQNDVRQDVLDQRSVVVEPLTEEQCSSLLGMKFGDIVLGHTGKLFENSKGNPYFLEQLVEGFDPETGSFESIPLAQVIDSKLVELPADASTLLGVIAVSGKALSVEEASRVAGHGSYAYSTITHMRSERLVRLIGSQDEQLVDTYHDKIRETVLDRMAKDNRCELHKRFGEIIEQSERLAITESQSSAEGAVHIDAAAISETTSVRVFDLAYHYFEAGDPRAFGYTLQAGEASLRAYAVEDAIEHLNKAKNIMPDTADRRTQYRLAERLAVACAGALRPQKAVEHYEHALQFTSDKFQIANCYNEIGEAYHVKGDFGTAVEYFDKSLENIGYHRSKAMPVVLLETGWVLFKCLVGSWMRPPYRSALARQRAGMAATVFHRTAFVISQRNLLRYTHASAKLWVAALGSGDDKKIAFAISTQSFNNAVFSLFFLARLMANRTAAYADRVVEPSARGELNIVRGSVLYFSGQFSEAEQQLKDGCNILDRVGHSWWRGLGYHNLRHTYHLMGRADDELVAARKETAIAETLGDAEGICWGYYGIANALARIGQLQESSQYIQRALDVIAGRESIVVEPIALHIYGYFLMQSSDYARAREALEKSRRIIKKNYSFVEYCVRTYPLLIQSIVGPDWKTSRDGSDIKQARGLCRVARFLAWRFPNIRPHTLRVQGRTACVRGDLKAAKRYFAKSIRVAREMGAEYDLAQALLDLSAIDDLRRATLRDEAVVMLKRIKAVIPYAERWLLGESPNMDVVASAPDEIRDTATAQTSPNLKNNQ